MMKDDDIIHEARERVDAAMSADLINREEAETDLRFAAGDHWDEDDRRERELAKKPVITINAMSQFVRQVTGQIRDLNPAIRVMPADGSATKEIAEINEGLIRHIEYQCDAADVYEGAAESAAQCGIGHWRIRTDYVPGLSFDQEILIERIHNPFAVIWDPCAKDPTRKDAQYCFILDEMKREEFKKAYPKASWESLSEDNKPAGMQYFFSGDTVTVAEYYWIEHEKVKIGLLEDGRIIENPRPPMQYVKERMVNMPRVKWAKITGNEVLEGPQDVAGEFIPVVSVVGEELHMGEGIYRSSVIRFARDPQRLYNLAQSMSAEIMTLQPKAPYLVTTENVAGLEQFWTDANKTNRPYLPFNPDDSGYVPQRIAPPVPSSAVLQSIQIAGEDMKRTTGIYDASLGARSNETSGVGIKARQAEAQNGNSIYADNMVKSVTHTGRIIVGMIPKVYDTQRTIRILGEDDQETLVQINQVMQTENGEMAMNDMTVGRYDVRIAVGPSYTTKRQESSDAMMEFMRTNPQAAPLIGDLVAGMQDWPEADRVAERLRKALPPQLQEPSDKEQQDPQAMQQQQQAAQMAQLRQQMEMRKEDANTRKAEADAAKAEADAKKAADDAVKAQADAEEAIANAQKAQFELAQMMGSMPPGASPVIQP